MNVFRRFTGDGVKTLEFYGQVLGFGSIGAVGGVSRYQVGPSQLKFTKAGQHDVHARRDQRCRRHASLDDVVS